MTGGTSGSKIEGRVTRLEGRIEMGRSQNSIFVSMQMGRFLGENMIRIFSFFIMGCEGVPRRQRIVRRGGTHVLLHSVMGF